MKRSLLLVATSLAVAAAACTGQDGSATVTGPTGSTTGGGEPAADIAAQVASSDLYVGAPQDFQVGMFMATDEGVELVSFGTVDMTFAYLGADGLADPLPSPEGTFSGTYIAAPGTGVEDGEAPSLTAPDDARGVYANGDVVFDEPGAYEVTVEADIEGRGPTALTAAFIVRDAPQLPAPGQDALRTKNHVEGEKGIDPVAIDSRAQDGAPIPDPELHQATIARAIAQGRPALVLFATPVYCLSMFCGPTVEAEQALALDHAGAAEFIHIEIWNDFPNSVANEAAADWLLRDGDLTEPWLYLIGADGVILERWGPLFDPAQVGAALEALPA